MKLFNEIIRCIPIEPVHYPQVYLWAHSGDYNDYFIGSEAIHFEKIPDFAAKNKIFMVVDGKNPNLILGMACLGRIDDLSRNFHFGVLIDKKHQRNGLGREATKIMISYAFNSLNLYKAILTIIDGATASKKIAEDVGFDLEGVLKNEIFHDGEFHNVLRYGITRGPFNKRFKESSLKNVA